MVQLVRRDAMVLPMAREEHYGHARVGADPRRIARGTVWRDEELRLFVLEHEFVAEGRSPDNSDERLRHRADENPSADKDSVPASSTGPKLRGRRPRPPVAWSDFERFIS